MIRLNDTSEFVNALSLLIEKNQKENNRNREEIILNNPDTTFKLGQIDPGYSSGRPRIIFEGESVPSLKAYPYLSSYSPTAGDIVLLARVGNSYIVLGKRI